jgi:choline kinase
MKPSLLVLAAGIGSRFGGFKQMEPVGPNGERLIDYSIYDARKGGFGTIVFVISKKIEADFKGYMEQRYGKNAGFAYCIQDLDMLPPEFKIPDNRTKPWGTTHAVICCKEALSVPFAVINADDFYGAQTFSVLAQALANIPNNSKEFFMVAFEIGKTLSEFGSVARGVCTVADGRLVSIVEREKIRRDGATIINESADGTIITIPSDAVVSMNFWGFAPVTVFPLFEKGFAAFLGNKGTDLKAEYYLPAAVDEALASKECSVTMLYSSEKWFGMTYKEDLPMVKEHIKQKISENVYPERLF